MGVGHGSAPSSCSAQLISRFFTRGSLNPQCQCSVFRRSIMLRILFQRDSFTTGKRGSLTSQVKSLSARLWS